MPFKIKQKLKKGEPSIIEFTPDKAGTFPFKCSIFCGMGHRGMKGTIVVEEYSRSSFRMMIRTKRMDLKVSE